MRPGDSPVLKQLELACGGLAGRADTRPAGPGTCPASAPRPQPRRAERGPYPPGAARLAALGVPGDRASSPARAVPAAGAPAGAARPAAPAPAPRAAPPRPPAHARPESPRGSSPPRGFSPAARDFSQSAAAWLRRADRGFPRAAGGELRRPRGAPRAPVTPAPGPRPGRRHGAAGRARAGGRRGALRVPAAAEPTSGHGGRRGPR